MAESEARKAPAIGQMVHWTDPETGACRAAVVTRVANRKDPESDLDLCILCPDGLLFRRNVPHAARGADSWHLLFLNADE